MKNIILFFLIIIGFNIYPQVAYKYYEVPSGTTYDLNDIGILNSYGSFICGNNGTFLKIYNADSVCRPVNSNTLLNINSFFKYNSSYYYYIMFFGDNGLILSSTSSGYSWYPKNTGFSDNLYNGIFYSGGNVYSTRTIVVGNNGAIIYRKYYPTSDSNWKVSQSGTNNNLKCITNNIYPNNIFYPYLWICGSNGTILKSMDTGNTWNALNSGTVKNLNSIYFRTQDTGIVVGDEGIILKTVNGGLNWTQKNSSTIQNLKRINVYNDSTYYIAGNKVVLISTNKGENWNIDTAAPKYNFNSVNFIYSEKYQKNIPFFVGEAGKVYKKILDTAYHPNINVLLNGNNVSAPFNKYGTFNQVRSTSNRAGFEWPKGSGKTAVYTSGLCIGAFVNNQLKQVSASYTGEYQPGYCEHGIFETNENFKYYKISRGDNALNNWDWANWGLMVPFGAPFIDVNHNGIFEPLIDTPGVKNATQTIFYCMTDADWKSHTAGEGFGGGTLPLGAEVHLTAWVYDSSGLQDVQFIHYTIINKSDSIWKRTFMGIFSDPDLGDANDDATGCDTSLKLSYCYNIDNNDYTYGANPPAVGFTLLSSPINKSVLPYKEFGLSSSTSPYKYFSNCEGEFGWYYKGAYLALSGLKNDSSSYLDPTQSPFRKTKYVYTGDPETNIGWTVFKGSIANCNNDSTGNIQYVGLSGGDVKKIFSSGANDFNMAPGDTQRFVIAQLIARGSNNLNSVTVLKSLCSQVRNFYESNFPFVINPTPVINYPATFMLDQNYPNPFNATTRIKFHIPKINGTVSGTVHVSLKIYDLLGRLVQTLVNGDYSAQDYEIIFDGKNFASGMYFYKMTAGDYSSVKRMMLIK